MGKYGVLAKYSLYFALLFQMLKNVEDFGLSRVSRMPSFSAGFCVRWFGVNPGLSKIIKKFDNNKYNGFF